MKADLQPRIAVRLDEAERRVAELTAFAASLRRALDHLDALPDRSVPGDPECGFLVPAVHDVGAQERVQPVPLVLSPRRHAAELGLEHDGGECRAGRAALAFGLCGVLVDRR